MGHIFYTSDEFEPWLAKFNDIAYNPLFAGLDAEGLRGCTRRSLDLDSSFSPKKVRFKTRLNPMESKVLKEKISKGILEFFHGAVRSNNR